MDTIEIRIQGGISAANGITGIFMVHSVEAVSSVDKVRRDADRARDFQSKSKQNSLFSQILNQKTEDLQKDSMECHTVTYGQDSKLRTFLYQSREYSY